MTRAHKARVTWLAALTAGGGGATIAVCAGGCGDDTIFAAPEAGSSEAASLLPAPPRYDGGAAAEPVTCGANTCSPGDYLGLATLPACCTPSGACGLDLRPAAKFEGVGEACTPLANAGVADDLCPSYTRGEEDGGRPVFERQGCCLPDKTCGVFVKLTPSLDLGCVAPGGFVVDAGPTPISCARDAQAD